jgi:hypothetical protein
MNKIFQTNTLLLITGLTHSSNFARINFPRNQILFWDNIRDIISDTYQDYIASEDETVSLLLSIVKKRLKAGLFTPVVLPPFVKTAIIHDLQSLCNRYYFNYEAVIIHDDETTLEFAREQNRSIKNAGIHTIIVLDQKELLNYSCKVVLPPVYSSIPPPYDIIGDVHGCREELEELLEKLGYKYDDGLYLHPLERKPVFLGDIIDRGPDSLWILNLVLNLCQNKKAIYIPGNHEILLFKYFQNKTIKQEFGIETTISEMENLNPDKKEQLKERFLKFMDNCSPYLILDGGNLLVTHGAIRESMMGRLHKKIWRYCMYGSTTGEIDEQGFPVRLDWAFDYTGEPLVVYGHVPLEEATLRNKTINIDTGCIFGGKLTAFSYPEQIITQVTAKRRYYCKFMKKAL